jgi:hypothetical protein
MITIAAFRRFFRAENTGGFDGDIYAHVFPWQFRGVSGGEYFNFLAVDDKSITFCFDGAGPFAFDSIVFKQMCQAFGVGEVVYGDQFKFTAP